MIWIVMGALSLVEKLGWVPVFRAGPEPLAPSRISCESFTPSDEIVSTTSRFLFAIFADGSCINIYMERSGAAG